MGGVENHVYQVSRRLAQAGVSVTVVSTDTAGNLPKTEMIDGVNLIRVRSYPRRSDWYFSPEVYRVARNGDAQGRQWDLVHIQNYLTFTSPMAMAGALRAGVPYIVTFHGGGHPSRLRNAIRGVQNQAYAPLLRRANKLIATAKFEVNAFGKALNVPSSQFAYIPNGCDIAANNNVAAQPLNPVAPLILSVGRLERYKGHQQAIAAMPHVLREMPNAKLRIVGAGDYEGELNALIVRLALQASAEVRAVRPTDRQGMAEVLASASLVMLMSEYETHPMAMLEAIALGRSVLVSNTSGLQELADDGYAQAAPLHSTPQQLAATMLNQLRHPHRPKTMHLPTWDECADGLLKLYQEIVRQPVARLQATQGHSTLQFKDTA